MDYDRLESVPWIRKTFYAICGFLVLLDLVFETNAPFPGFSALLGAGACALIIIVSKPIGKLWLQRREDFYD